MVYKKKCLLILGYLSCLWQELHEAQQGIPWVVLFVKHLFALPQSLATAHKMLVRHKGGYCHSWKWCVAMCAPRKGSEVTSQFSLGRGKCSFHFQEKMEQCGEWKCTDCNLKRQRLSPKKIALISYCLIRVGDEIRLVLFFCLCSVTLFLLLPFPFSLVGLSI